MGIKFDGVLVAGAGPVGLVTALKIARAGIPVAVVDAEPAIPRWPRAIVYHSPTVEELAKLGVLEDMKAVGVLKQDYQFRALDGTIFANLDMSVIAGDTAYPYNLHLSQHVLGEVVLQHLLRVPGVSVRWNARVTAVAQSADGVSATVHMADEMVELRAAWLVGADGGRSGVRQALGLRFDGFTWPDRFVATNVRYDFEAHGFARATFILDPVDWAIIPVIDQHGLWRVAYGEDASLPEEEVRSRAPERIARMLHGDTAFTLEYAAPYRIHQRAAERFRAGRVLLAGDAAHVTNPCGGLGLTSGLLDAVHLADALIAVIQRTAPEAVLDEYAAERRNVFLNVTSPAATENKRRLAEADPVRRQRDVERLRKVQDDRALQRDVLLFTHQLKSKPYSYGPS